MELTAEIKVNANESYPVEEMVFGHFIEHLGRCIKDGIWDERDIATPREFGMVRNDVFDAMKALRPPVIRYPGGCFSDTYHWRDGVGHAARRPRRLNRAWWRLKIPHTLFENNHFGTDEFVELCRRLGAEPYININFGSGSPKEASEWVEYCNAPVGTKLGDARAENGHPAPHNVKFWGIANEVWGIHETGFCLTGAQYARRYMPFYEAMKSADPEIKTVAVGANRWFPRWNGGFLKRAGRFCDYLSIHEYAPGPNPLHPATFSGFPETERAYYAMLAGAEMFADTLMWARGQIVEAMGEGGAVKIAFDEWNAWWEEGQLIRAENYTLRDGLMAACALSRLVKMSPFVGMANFAQFVNAIGMIITFRDGMYTTPQYQAFKLYRDGVYDDVLDVKTECGAVRTKWFSLIRHQRAMPLVEALATRKRRGGDVSLLLVNKHFGEPVSARVSLAGFRAAAGAETRILSAESPFDGNSLEEPNRVSARKGKARVGGAEFRLTLPPHSVVQVTLKPEKRAKTLSTDKHR